MARILDNEKAEIFGSSVLLADVGISLIWVGTEMEGKLGVSSNLGSAKAGITTCSKWGLVEVVSAMEYSLLRK